MLTSYSIKNIYSHFEYEELQKIVGEPRLDTILLLHRQVKWNAQSFPTTLGGSQLKFLALVIAEENYNAIPAPEPFKRPSDPGTFSLQVPSTVTLQSPTSTVQRTTRSTSRAPQAADLITTDPTQTAIISSTEVTMQKAAHEEAVKR